MNEQQAVTITKHLPVKLDPYRQNVLNTQMRDSTMEEERIALHLKNVNESLRASIKEHTKKRVIAAVALSNGYEMQAVSCELKMEGDHMVTYRVDTGEKVDERALSVEELREARKGRKA